MAGPNCDALALLVVRLDSDRPVDGVFSWHPWDQAVGAETHKLSEQAASGPQRHSPFKRLPTEGNSYFSPNARQVLFPPENEHGGRWVCCPDEVYLDVDFKGEPGRSARVDLLEWLTAPGHLGTTFGLIHLSLCEAETDPAPGTLSWGSAIRATYRKHGNPAELFLRRGDEKVTLDQRPLRNLVEELFGEPHEELDRHLYTMVMANYPEEAHDSDAQRKWRWALAKRHYRLDADLQNARDLEKGDRQTIQLTDITGLVLGNCAMFALPRPIDGMAARNFRSNWTESLLLGLLQQECLEGFQQRLVRIGDPGDPEGGDLHRDWLSFRHRVWWSQISTAEAARDLLSLFRRARGTDQLFAELNKELTSYGEVHRQAIEDERTKRSDYDIYLIGVGIFGGLTTIGGMAASEFDLSLRAFIAIVTALFLFSVGLTSLLYRRRHG